MKGSNLKKQIKILQAIIQNRKITSCKKNLKHICDDDDIASCLRIVCKNLINGKIPLKSTQIKQLKKHKPLIRQIAKRGNSKAKKKKLIVQSGGFLPAVLPIITTLISLLD